MSKMIQVGDEDSFVAYAEDVVFEIQRMFIQKLNSPAYAVVDISARLEDMIYRDALKEHSASAATNVWDKKECIVYYTEMTSKLLYNIQTKAIKWKEVFDSDKNAVAVFQMVMRDDYQPSKHSDDLGEPIIYNRKDSSMKKKPTKTNKSFVVTNIKKKKPTAPIPGSTSMMMPNMPETQDPADYDLGLFPLDMDAAETNFELGFDFGEEEMSKIDTFQMMGDDS